MVDNDSHLQLCNLFFFVDSFVLRSALSPTSGEPPETPSSHEAGQSPQLSSEATEQRAEATEQSTEATEQRAETTLDMRYAGDKTLEP